MCRPALIVALSLVLLAIMTSPSLAQSTNASLQLRLAVTNNRVELLLDGSAPSGALFIYQSSDPRRLVPCPPVVVQTNTPLTNGLRFSVPLSTRRFFQAVHWPSRPVQDFTNQTMVYVPAGTFWMGDSLGEGATQERPVHAVQTSGFWMDKHEVSLAVWNEVRTWAEANGYSFDSGIQAKAANHPIHGVSWYNAVKWCNARSEKEGRVPAYYTEATLSPASVYRAGQVSVRNDWVNWESGYRLPTEAEWEKAARGGASGLRFPCLDNLSHAQVNYYSSAAYEYDVSPSREYHPTYATLPPPYTSPIGTFASSGHGLFDMAGNVQEWCWDLHDPTYYVKSPTADPIGPTNGTARILRGGSWSELASRCRVAYRSFGSAEIVTNNLGFRTVMPAQSYAVPPVVLRHPQGVTNAAGSALHLSVSLGGAGPLTIQWRTNAVTMTGATNGTLNLIRFTNQAEVSFDVVVSNPFGTVTSGVAVLQLGAVPRLPPGMVYITGRSYRMGDNFGEGLQRERPTHLVNVNSFHMDRTEVSKSLWDDIYRWATNNGYRFDYADSGQGKSPNHPAHTMTWYDAVKWCNARSEKEGLAPAYYMDTTWAPAAIYRVGQIDVQNNWVRWEGGYRLPTEAEWEMAVRGGSEGQRFASGATIMHSQANFLSVHDQINWYDLSPTFGYHPAYNDGIEPFTSPVDSFDGNGFGLYGMMGNVIEMCWDWLDDDSNYYSSSPFFDPKGPAAGSMRVLRGGGWTRFAVYCRSAWRSAQPPGVGNNRIGFRAVLAPVRAPAIAQQPVNRISLPGTTADFAVVATGTAPLSYQWRWDGSNLSEGTNSTLTLANVQTNQAGNYDVVVANAYGSATSSVAVLTVALPPTVTGQPQSRSNEVGTLATFSVAATGTGPLSYQWRRGGANLADGGNVLGSTTATLTLAVTAGDGGSYDVVVRNAYATATSSVAVLTVVVTPPEPSGMVLIPAGSFAMGDTVDGSSYALPVHTVTVSAFYMDRTEVTKALWDEVYGWAITNGYGFDYADSGQGKASTHPAHTMTWYDAVKWCNARSEKEGRVPAYYTEAGLTNVYRSGQVNVQNDWVRWTGGYRLPTEAEWEKAARGGVPGQRFGFGDTITHLQANYYSSTSYAYDVSATRGYHPSYNDGVSPFTSPAGSFGTNGYGLSDMVGNVWEWCWDWYAGYSASPSTDPQGPATGSQRVLRGGGWFDYAVDCRSAKRHINNLTLDFRYPNTGLRAVLPLGQP